MRIRQLFGHDGGRGEGPTGGGPGEEVKAQAERLILGAARSLAAKIWIGEAVARQLPNVPALLDAPEPIRTAALVEAARLGAESDSWWFCTATMTRLLGRKAHPDSADVIELLDHVLVHAGRSSLWSLDLEAMLPAIEWGMRRASPVDAAAAQVRIRRALELLASKRHDDYRPTTGARLRALLPHEAHDPVDVAAFLDTDHVGPAMRDAVLASPETPAVLGPFVAHVTKPVHVKDGRPSDRWCRATRQLGATLADPGALLRAMLRAAVDAEDWWEGGRANGYPRFAGDQNEATLRSAIWAAGALGDAEAIPLLKTLTGKAATIVGGLGGQPRGIKIASACVGAVALTGAPNSLTALLTIQRTVRHNSVQKAIAKTIDSMAARANVSTSELLETAVERHDLDADGRRLVPVGDVTARIEVKASGEVELAWIDAMAAPTLTVPKAVKAARSDEVKAVSVAAKALRETVGVERARLDRLFAERRTWPIDTWRARYLEHPLVGALARGLVWRFRTGDIVRDGIPNQEGSVTGVDGIGFVPDAAAQVELWHPIEAAPDEVLRWRRRLIAEQRRQPLKQAFREVYLLTPAEEQTRTYSNRFAGHIFRQVQARALMKLRGWLPVVVAEWDGGDEGVARRTYGAWGYRVEFSFDAIRDVPPAGSALIPYCSSDQVRFFRLDGDAVDLAEIPRLLFSEVMRDVDLFIGVTTIGADPQWLDRGERRFDPYWHAWGFGELSQAAAVRHEVLSAILPGLAIADRCTLDDRYLTVRGDLHTYRIHLGSSNVMVSPGDAYVCIVASRAKADERLFLTFDDDPTLSLILSKASLLANDRAITDESILRQIQR